MTLARTIKRRDRRKRAKLRPKHKGTPFITAEWMIRDSIAAFTDSVKVIELFNRQHR